MITLKKIALLSGVSANSTSSAVGVNKAGDISIQLTAASVTTGGGVFLVQVSNDNSNWTTYNRLTSNVTNTNAQQDTRVASVTLSANGSSMIFIPKSDVFAFMRVVFTAGTDGTYSAVAYGPIS